MQKLVSQKITGDTAFRFVILLGLISLLADMVYEGARSITGPFLAELGATGAIVGFVAGLGEFVGYTLRFFSGRWVDRTSKYWQIAFLGYFFTLITIPMLAFVGSWQMAAFLLIFERIGKALRTPPRDAMLSYATQKMGRGYGFGVHQALDQAGGMLGPLAITAALLLGNNYRLGFAILVIPALLSIIILLFARNLYPDPRHLEVEVPDLNPKKTTATFWLYLIGTALLAAGYADFPLIAFHFQKTHLLTPIWIPLFYSIAMCASAVSALFFGWSYDKDGYKIIILTIALSSLVAPLVFLGNFYVALLGMILWGIGIGAQRSVLKAVVGDMVTKKIRGSAYGIFNTIYGIAWFLGSFLIGVLYDTSIEWLIIFSISTQLLAIPFVYWVAQRQG